MLMTGRPAGILQRYNEPVMARKLQMLSPVFAEARQLSGAPCVVRRAEGAGSAQLADSVQLLEPGRPGQCGDHAAVPGGPVLCPHRHAGAATPGDAQHRCSNNFVLRGH